MLEFASLPNSVAIASGPRFSYLIYHSTNMGWWLDVYRNMYASRDSDSVSWVWVRRASPVDCAVVRSHELAVTVANAYESLTGDMATQLSMLPSGLMDDAMALAGCAS